MPPGRKDNQPLKERAYQLEMLQASLQQNIIVAVRSGRLPMNSQSTAD